MTQDLNHTPLASSSKDSVCVTRTTLLNKLASTIERLGRAKLSLRDCEDQRDFLAERFITRELEQLRSDCGVLRAELELHRAAHGC
jgi:sporulation-control protein spo0M